MEIPIILVFVIGTILVFAWGVMTALALGCKFFSYGMDEKWQQLVLGFFAFKTLAWKIAIACWFVTCLVSGAGWVMGFVFVWQDEERSPTSELHAQKTAFLQLCIAQLSVLLAWTVVLVCVQPRNSLWYR